MSIEIKKLMAKKARHETNILDFEIKLFEREEEIKRIGERIDSQRDEVKKIDEEIKNLKGVK